MQAWAFIDLGLRPRPIALHDMELHSREPRGTSSSPRSRPGTDASPPRARRRCDDAGREAVMSATIEREQAVGELARFLRQQAGEGEQDPVTALAEAIPQIVW